MNIKDFIESIIKEEMRALKEDDVAVEPGQNWSQPGVTDAATDDDMVKGSTAEIVQRILDLLADYDTGLEGAIEVVHALADELGLVPADEVEPERRPIGFVREGLKKRLSESSYEEIMRIRDSGDYSWRDMEYEVVDLMEAMQTFPAKDVIEIMYDALDAEDRQDINFWHMMLGNGGHLYQALDGLKATGDDEYMPDTVTEKKLPPHWLEQGIKADPTCDKKVPDGASMSEYKKCLKNPAAYQKPERGSMKESKGRNSHQVAARGHDTAHYAGAEDAHQAVVDAGGYERPPAAMMRLMRTIAQAAQGMNLSPAETLELAQSMLDADMLTTAEADPTGSLEENESGPRVPETDGDFRSPTQNALQGQELLDALASDISDMFKDINGFRPRWIKFNEMSLEELENLHDLTTRQHKDWWNQERVEQDLDDINYEKEQRNAMQHDADVENARIDAIEAETERMREPEEGEEQAKQSGMGRRYSPGKLREADSWSSFSDAKTLFEGWRKFTKE